MRRSGCVRVWLFHMPCLALLGAFLCACSHSEGGNASHDAHAETTGSVTIPLIATVGASVYRLSGTIDISWNGPPSRHAEFLALAGDSAFLERALPVGSYTFALRDDWQLWRGPDNVTAQAALAAAAAGRVRSVTIAANASTHVTWAFTVAGQPVVLDPCVPSTSAPQCTTGDADADGVTNGIECTAGAATGACVDSDGDAQPDYLDLDSDNDGASDASDPGRLDPCNPAPFAPVCLNPTRGSATISVQVTETCDGGQCTFGSEPCAPDGGSSCPGRVVQLAAGREHTCALLASGRAMCWGYNQHGQLGDGTTTSRSRPTEVQGLSSAVELAAGPHHTCARLNSGAVSCWGSNESGQLGDGTWSLSRVLAVQVQDIANAVQLATMGWHTCARLDSGRISCWGSNSHGQLGDGSVSSRPVPMVVSGLSDVAEIGAGASHTCARLGSGRVSCWGRNGNGELGDGTTSQRLVPVSVEGLTSAAQIALGVQHSCARLSSGAVSCWGANDMGQLGDGLTASRAWPAPVSGLTDAIELAVGGYHVCTERASGAVSCWGSNYEGQLGDLATATELLPATLSVSNPVELALGGFHSCTRLASGTVTCWGANWVGQLGNGTTTDRSLPVTVQGLP